MTSFRDVQFSKALLEILELYAENRKDVSDSQPANEPLLMLSRTGHSLVVSDLQPRNASLLTYMMRRLSTSVSDSQPEKQPFGIEVMRGLNVIVLSFFALKHMLDGSEVTESGSEMLTASASAKAPSRTP